MNSDRSGDWQTPTSFFGFYLPAGVLLSYLPAYLTAKGLTSTQVAFAFSAVFAVKLATGPLLAWWADAVGKQRSLLLLTAILILVSTLALGFSEEFNILLVAVVVMSVCRNYCQCVLEALATTQGLSGSRYGIMRAIGSAAVFAGVILFGGLWSANIVYQQIMLPVMLLISGSILTVAVYSTDTGQPIIRSTMKPTAVNSLRTERRPYRFLLLLGATLLIGANGVFYSSATLLLQERGIAAPNIAMLWLVAFGVEAIGFAYYDKIRQKLPTMSFFFIVVVLALLRWGLLLEIQNIWFLLAAFALHVASFSWMHAFCANWIREIWSDRYAATGQSLYTACAHGIGMAIAAFLTGVLLPEIKQGVFVMALAMTTLGATVIGIRATLQRTQLVYGDEV